MNITIPLRFRAPWNNFFTVAFPNFLGYDSYSFSTPIVQAIIGFSRLLVAFGIVFLVGFLITKVIKELFK